MPAVISTSIGNVAIDWTGCGISRVRLLVPDKPSAPGPDAPAFVTEACGAIFRHLSGEMQDFSEIPVDFGSASMFCMKIWRTLRNISRPGSILTYRQLAEAAGSPGAARAAGAAMRLNPVPIIVACHRVVAASGPGGYSAGAGLQTKRLLLDIEASGFSPGRSREVKIWS